MSCSTCHDSGKVKARDFPTVYVNCHCKTSKHTTMTTPYQIIKGTELSAIQFGFVATHMSGKHGNVSSDFIDSHEWYFNGDSFLGVWR